jgi:hypothetical protein
MWRAWLCRRQPTISNSIWTRTQSSWLRRSAYSGGFSTVCLAPVCVACVPVSPIHQCNCPRSACSCCAFFTLRFFASDGFVLNQYQGRAVLITGCGYPDVQTRVLLRRISEMTDVPIYGIADWDPHGWASVVILSAGRRAIS